MAANLTMVRIATKLDDLFNEKIDISDVKTSDDDRSTFYSRAIAALSIMIQCGIDETLSGSCVTDGYHDMGIDAVYNDSTQKKLDEEIAHAGKAVQIFEIEVEYLSGKEIQER